LARHSTEINFLPLMAIMGGDQFGRSVMDTARIVQSYPSQAPRLPKAYRFEGGINAHAAPGPPAARSQRLNNVATNNSCIMNKNNYNKS
jgi:hypothetical protein